MRMTEGQLRRIVREALREATGETMSIDDEVSEYIRKHFVPGEPLELPAHLVSGVVTSSGEWEGPGARAAMKFRKPKILGLKRPENIDLGEPGKPDEL